MAANRPHVPKFGDWKQEDVAFTVMFDKASRTKQNPNMSNPNEHPNMNPNPAQTPNHRYDQPPNHNVRPRHERFSSREEAEFRPSPAHNERNNRVRAPPPAETYNHQSYGGGGRSHGNPQETKRRPQHEPPRVQSTPIRNLRGRSNERVAIPPFPGSGSENQSYTLIFDKVKEDKRQSGNMRSYSGSAHTTPSRPLNDQHHQPLPSSPKNCCFPPWGRK
ncbi:defense protein-related [Raphanus sativus]|uniref:RPM1-interacting protein 4-like n=1 Tax=Raphanus sativus TaxID=3726 RepID=A0A6J0L5S6_RAPSA|nr:RPM1-interacting protein 4-like [Raphanus sativus]KAJ4877764.1 defense protein-related [Raphanus sativus]